MKRKYIFILKLIRAFSPFAKNRNYKESILKALPYWLGATITGVVAVLYAKLFAQIESISTYLFKTHGMLFLLITPATFILAWLIVQKMAPFSKGSGIPQVTAAIMLSTSKLSERTHHLLSFKVIISKIASSIVLIFGGGAIGREGPTIQISASVFKIIHKLLPKWYPKISLQNMIITGAAAGLASAFNTPLGGIVFAIEELTKIHVKYFKSELLTGVIISGLTALILAGPYLYLGIPDTHGVSWHILLGVIPVALLCGISGAGMGTIILLILRVRELTRGRNWRVFYIGLSGLIVAVVAIFVHPGILGSGNHLILNSLFTEDKHLEWYVPLLRIAGSIISFSSGGSGGIFAPSLAAGASIGAVMSDLLGFTAQETNVLILCGMVGVLTGITRSPFTASVLVLEMTDGNGVIFHLMLTALLSNLSAGLISKHSFYDNLTKRYVADVRKITKGESNVSVI